MNTNHPAHFAAAAFLAAVEADGGLTNRAKAVMRSILRHGAVCQYWGGEVETASQACRARALRTLEPELDRVAECRAIVRAYVELIEYGWLIWLGSSAPDNDGVIEVDLFVNMARLRQAEATEIIVTGVEARIERDLARLASKAGSPPDAHGPSPADGANLADMPPLGRA